MLFMHPVRCSGLSHHKQVSESSPYTSLILRLIFPDPNTNRFDLTFTIEESQAENERERGYVHTPAQEFTNTDIVATRHGSTCKLQLKLTGLIFVLEVSGTSFNDQPPPKSNHPP